MPDLNPSQPGRQWWRPTERGEDLRACAFSFAERLESSSGESERRSNFLDYATRYLGRPIASLNDFVSSGSSAEAPRVGPGRAKRNFTRMLVDTAMSRFAKTETRVQYSTMGASPADQERGEEGTDAANALLEQTESEVELRKAALHACVFDLGVVKVIDHDDGPTVEHVPSWEIKFDPADAHRGKPTILVQEFPADRDALIADFAAPEENDDEETLQRKRDLADRIRISSSMGLQTPDHTATDQHCLVYELWRLPVGRTKGRHVVVTDKALCLDEEWTEKKFPFVFFGVSAALFGVYPESYAAMVGELQDEANGATVRISQILRLLSVPRWLEEGASGEEIAESQIRGGSESYGDVVRVPPGKKLTLMAAMPVVGAELINYPQQLEDQAHKETGISPQAVLGSRPAGLNSAPAQREWNEIQQDRLSLIALDYQKAHVDLARLLLDSVSRIPEYEINVKDANGRWLKKLKAKNLDLDRSNYIIQRFPVSALPTTPTGKLAAAADLLQMGAIDREQFQQVVQFPDLKSQINLNLASRKATEKLVGKMLRTGQYEPPPDALDYAYAVKYAAARYVDGIAEDMPQDRLDLLVDWIADIKARLAKLAPAAPASTAGTSIAPITPQPLAAPPAAMPRLPGITPGAGLGMS